MVTNLWEKISRKLCILFVGSSLGRCIGPTRWWRWPVCKKILLLLQDRKFVDLVTCLFSPPALLLLSSMVSSSSLVLAICWSASCNTLLLLLLAQMLACWFCWSFSFPSLSPARTTYSENTLTMESPVAKSWPEQQSSEDCMERKFPKTRCKERQFAKFSRK